MDFERENKCNSESTAELLHQLESLASEWESVLATRLLPAERRLRLHLRREEDSLRMQEERLQRGTVATKQEAPLDETSQQRLQCEADQADARRERHERRRRKISGSERAGMCG